MWQPQELPEVTVTSGSLRDDGSADPLTPETTAVAVPLAPGAEGDEGPQPRAGTADVAARYRIDLSELSERLRLTGGAGQCESVHLPRSSGTGAVLPWQALPRKVLLVGLGSGEPTDLRRAGAALARATRGEGRVVTTVAADAGPEGLRQVAEGYLLAAYRVRRHPIEGAEEPQGDAVAEPAGSGTTEPDGGLPEVQPGATRRNDEQPADQLVLLGRAGPAEQEALAAAQVAAAATWLARDLSATPSNLKDPQWLADRAEDLATAAGLTVQVRGPEELAAEGFGGLLAVGGGSASTPRLVTVAYRPDRRAAAPHVVLVGKGITYDTGGLSIKPREAMVPMKTDMTGAAVVLATVLGAARARLPLRVTAVLPLAENAVSGSSYRPGDVVRTYDGTTVEIANTDAEGRMVLADALGFACAELGPDVVVDVATLTGAASLGLGRRHGALFTPDDALAEELTRAGAESGELLWRLPLVEDYRPALRSEVADLRHVPAEEGIGGGAITAALFLQHFVGSRRWAHLDIAGPARSSSASHEVTEGATGFGARALLRWLEALG